MSRRLSCPCRMAVAIAVLLVLVVVTPAVSEDEGGAPEFKPLRVDGKPQAALLDCRSLTLAHETYLPLDTWWPTQGHRFRSERSTGGRIALHHVPPEAEGRPRKRTLSDEPLLYRYKRGRMAYALSARVDVAGKGIWLASAFGAPLPVGRPCGWLVDSDLDGVLGSAGDGYVAPLSRTVAPWKGVAWSRTTALRIRKEDDGTWVSQPIAPPHPEDKEHAAAWRLLQWRRQQCGLLTIDYEPLLEAGLVRHAEYCVVNDYRGHDQILGRKAYSEEGAVAGKASVLGFNHVSVFEGMDEQIATLYHRNQVLSPALSRSAFILHRGVFVMNVRHATDSPLREYPLVFPAHGMAKVRCTFSTFGERPMPIPSPLKINRFATAVSVSFATLELASSLPAAPTLTLCPLDKKGRTTKPLWCANHYPGQPPETGVGIGNGGAVSATHFKPLQPRTTYHAHIEARLPGTNWAGRDDETLIYDWEFTTTP